jgi:hypothetical protein
LDEDTKYGYIVGFLEGMFLGHCFTTWEISDDTEENKAWQSASNSYNENYNRFVVKTTYQRFFDGLNALYSDYRNLKIEIRHGMWIVMNEISGRPEQTMKTMIEAFREKRTGENPPYGSTSPSSNWSN